MHEELPPSGAPLADGVKSFILYNEPNVLESLYNLLRILNSQNCAIGFQLRFSFRRTSALPFPFFPCSCSVSCSFVIPFAVAVPFALGFPFLFPFVLASPAVSLHCWNVPDSSTPNHFLPDSNSTKTTSGFLFVTESGRRMDSTKIGSLRINIASLPSSRLRIAFNTLTIGR